MKLKKGYFDCFYTRYKYWQLGDCIVEKDIQDLPIITCNLAFSEIYKDMGAKYICNHQGMWIRGVYPYESLDVKDIRKEKLIQKFNDSFENALND